MALGETGPGRLGLVFESATLCTLQDGREFDSDCYQLYPRLGSGRPIRAGTRCRIAMTLIPGDATPLPPARVTLERHGTPALSDIAAGPPSARHLQSGNGVPLDRLRAAALPPPNGAGS